MGGQNRGGELRFLRRDGRELPEGYTGDAEFDAEAGLFHGEVLDTRDVITFQGLSVEELERAFRGCLAIQPRMANVALLQAECFRPARRFRSYCGGAGVTSIPTRHSGPADPIGARRPEAPELQG